MIFQADPSREKLISARKRLGHTQLEMSRRLQIPIGKYKKWEGAVEPVPAAIVLAAESLPLAQEFDTLGDPERAVKYRAIISDLRAGISRAEVAAKHGVQKSFVQYLANKYGIPRAPSVRTTAIVNDLKTTQLPIRAIAERHCVSHQHVAYLRKKFVPNRLRARKRTQSNAS